MNKQELVEFFHTTESNVTTNFPKFATKQLAKGWKITKIGVGSKADYQVEQVEPQIVDSSYFSSRPKPKETDKSDLPGEVWKPLFLDSRYLISNKGRLKQPSGKMSQGYLSSKGYLTVSVNDMNYAMHRLVLQTFDPRDDYRTLTVDHINGIRDDNRLENLRWATSEDNTLWMMLHRSELNKELTRIIQKHGYEETLTILREID